MNYLINVLNTVYFDYNEHFLFVHGPHGCVNVHIPIGFYCTKDYNLELDNICLKQDKENLYVCVYNLNRSSFTSSRRYFVKAMLGTMMSIINSAIYGVINRFNKILELRGVGFKVNYNLSEKLLKLNIGFSHEVCLTVLQNLDISVSRNFINISGCDKHIVSNFASKIIKLKRRNKYSGTGIFYKDEVYTLKPVVK